MEGAVGGGGSAVEEKQLTETGARKRLAKRLGRTATDAEVRMHVHVNCQ
jgi:hypothetical protein